MAARADSVVVEKKTFFFKNLYKFRKFALTKVRTQSFYQLTNFILLSQVFFNFSLKGLEINVYSALHALLKQSQILQRFPCRHEISWSKLLSSSEPEV